MNRVVFFIVINLFLLSTTCLPQGITNEEKQRIIAELDSSDYMTRYWAIDAIGEYEIVEAVPKLESIFWQQEPQLQGYILKRLLSLNAENTYNLTKAFLDSIPDYSFEGTIITPLDLQVTATYILFSYGDYSTVDYVFQIIERDSAKSRIDPLAKSLLPIIIENVPAYAELAKEELIKLVNNQSTRYSDRTLSLLYLSEIYGQEILPLIETSFTSDQDPIVRSSALELLFQNNDPNLNQLLKDRLKIDPEPTFRYKLATTLLDSFGTPSDYRAVLDYQAQETNEVNATLVYFDLYGFTPPKIDSSVSTTSSLDTLISYTIQSFQFNWLGDIQFNNELQNILQIAKANLQSGDSLACRADVKAFQDSVNYVYADSLNADPRFVTLEGWKFLYWNAQYILDRLPELPIGEVISTYSIFATHSLKLNQYSVIVQSGDIGVNEAGLEPFLDPGYELSVGANATTPAGYKVKANRIKLNQNSVINGDIYYNQLNNSQGIINGTETTPLELPLFIELTEFKTSIPGTENIIVSNGQTRVLSPGSYGDVTINKNGTLVLTGGVYHFNGFVGGQQSNINYQSPCEIRIAGKLDIGKLSNVIASDTTTYSAKDIVFYVAGINGTDGTLGATPKAAVIGTDSKIKANLYVPNGTLQIKANSEAEGSFIGKDVDIDAGVKVKLKSAF